MSAVDRVMSIYKASLCGGLSRSEGRKRGGWMDEGTALVALIAPPVRAWTTVSQVHSSTVGSENRERISTLMLFVNPG